MTPVAIGRRRWLRAALLAASALLPATSRAADKPPLPIVFVPGNGDTAAVWMTTIWRFESNGYPADRLEALDLRYPLAAKLYDTPEPFHSTVGEATQQLAAAVAAVEKRLRAPKVILIAHSRGGNIVRNYLKNAGGAAHTAIAILCGTPDHGVLVSDTVLVGSEFNGASPFLRGLNAGGEEVVPGVRFLTIRSDGNDKYAQPDGRFLGLPALATGIGPAGPALKGATNAVVAHADHRETGFGREAFALMYRFITGREPRTRDVRPEKTVTLGGKVSAFAAGVPTNIGLAGAVVEVYKVSRETGERMGNALLRKVTGEDGEWGPLKVEPKAHYEFILAVPGFPVTHIYRSAFPRSSRYVDLRPQMLSKEDREAGAVIYISRPRGYFGVGRDRVLIDGAPPADLVPGVPSVSIARIELPAEPQRTVKAVFNREQIALRPWPIKDDQVSVAEFTW
jgi:pimeloyl-ACP methyl ester carboxylesterase